ncbi:MAG: dTDP-4-dehydrorhamnose reductase [Lysobacterales bacterium]
MTQPESTTLLLGSSGQLGAELAATLPATGRVVTSARSDADYPCDLSDSDAVTKLLETVRPDHIVNAAAFTGVDQAETDLAAAQRLNAGLPAQLAAYLQPHNGILVHYSTDYVFPGSASTPYEETNTPAPVNAYGASKLAGEEQIRAANVRHLIFRTAWVYGRYGNNFVKTIVRLAKERETLSIVDDQFGRPTSAQFLAKASMQAFAAATKDDISGTFHLSASGEPVSWYGFALQFLAWTQTHQAPQKLAKPSPVDSTAFPSPARRPAYSVLDNTLFETVFGIEVPHWKVQLEESLPGFPWD